MTNRGTLGFPTKWSDPTTYWRRAPRLFNPGDYGTCNQWVRSSDFVFASPADTQLVTTWADQSGSGNDFGTGTTPAALLCQGALWYARAWRGFPGVRLGGTALVSTLTPVTGANVRTVVSVVSHPLYNNNTRNWLYVYGTNTNLLAFGLQMNSASFTYNSMTSNTNNNASTANARAATPDVLVHIYDGTNTKLYVNGTSALSVAQALNTTTNIAMRLGADLSAPPSSACYMTFYEFAVINADLTASQATIASVLQGQYEFT